MRFNSMERTGAGLASVLVDGGTLGAGGSTLDFESDLRTISVVARIGLDGDWNGPVWVAESVGLVKDEAARRVSETC
jgi:hypothetical protein